jgi:hypothetical protein
MIAGASLSVLERISKSTELRDRLHENTAYFRKEIERIGFTIKPGTHPVVPVMLFDAPVAQKFAARMFELGVLLSGFFYPVVPMGQARVRVQLSAAHTREQLDKVLAAFEQAGRELGIIKNNNHQIRNNNWNSMERILIIGANGQIGSELVSALADKHGAANVLATDIGADNVYGAARYTRSTCSTSDAWRAWSPTKASPRSTSWRRCCRPPARRRR